MPDLQEVFRMATQKVDQDHGALERQNTRQRSAARNRRVSVFATVAVLVAAVLGVFALSRSDTQETPANVPPPPTAMANGSMVDITSGAVTPLPAQIAAEGTFYAVSPDRSMLAYNACCSQPGPVMVANVDGTGAHPVTATGLDAYGAQWSPDGSLIVYQQRDASGQRFGNLFVVDPLTGRSTQLTDLDQSRSWSWWYLFPSFSADGRSVLFQMPTGRAGHTTWDLWSVPVDGGQQTLVQHDAGWGGYSPDGTQLAFLSPVDPADFSGGGLWMAGVDAGQPRIVVGHGHMAWPRWSPDGTRISYDDGGSIFVLDVASGSVTKVARGGNAEWFDDHTLIVGNPTN